MIKDKAKRFFIILSFLFIILSLPTITIHASSQNAILFEESSSADFGVFKDIIYNAREDIEDELKSKYGENNVRISYEVLTPYLSLANVDQTTLRDYYNNLGDKKHDLDHNYIITDKDKIGLEEGVCQPTAVSMALEYMVRRGNISYTPKLNSNSLDINNIFYDVVKAYIENDWRGGAAISGKCYQALNTYFQNNNINYEASYYKVDILNFIKESLNNYTPSIGHIKYNGLGHAVSICGYFTIVAETKKSNSVLFRKTFIVMNDGLIDSNYPIGGGGVDMETHNMNFSYVSLEYIDAVTIMKSK